MYATARRPEAVGEVPVGVHVLPLEVTDPASIEAAIKTVVQREGSIDVLINNAGIGCVGPLAEISLAQARQVRVQLQSRTHVTMAPLLRVNGTLPSDPLLVQTYEVNVLGTLAMIQSVVPHMAAQGRGKIINVSLSGPCDLDVPVKYTT